MSDRKTVMPEVQRLREDFGIEQRVMAGDRGMVSRKAIDEMRETDGWGWITALNSVSITALAKVASHRRDDGSAAHRWSTLPAELSTIARKPCRTSQSDDNASTFNITTTLNPKQKRALDLLQAIQMQADCGTLI